MLTTNKTSNKIAKLTFSKEFLNGFDAMQLKKINKCNADNYFSFWKQMVELSGRIAYEVVIHYAHTFTAEQCEEMVNYYIENRIAFGYEEKNHETFKRKYLKQIDKENNASKIAGK